MKEMYMLLPLGKLLKNLDTLIITQGRCKFKKSEYAKVQNLAKIYPLEPKICFILHFRLLILKSQGTPGCTRHTQWRCPCNHHISKESSMNFFSEQQNSHVCTIVLHLSIILEQIFYN